jgi:4-hydroxy-4-methyl-2-oxoglutarate aldolase
MLEDPPILTISRRIARPDPALLAAFRDMPTGFVVDSMEGRGALDHRIKPVDPDRAVFVGVALTCQCGPGDNLAILGAISVAEAGDVIVAAADGFLGLAVMGDRVAGMARNRGAVGLVTDAAVRDTPGIRAVGLPCFAGGVTPNSCAASGPGTVGLPVVIGGIAVASGDLLIADCDGVVVVPQARIAAIGARVREVAAAETAMDERVVAGLAMPGRITELERAGKIRFLD